MGILNKVWNVHLNVNLGYSFTGFSLGFGIGKFNATLDLGFFWVVIEW